ncbi:Glycoside hydrolase [Phytophthora palmivora]|uniref:Glycoside hydrolase n=1 Tax=Phytophthora palmivora TaxID=4796 RepID=A0A2P4X8D0_9STRA|nr:Glycoside hydrolase [Phytophthora palmivora]
MSSLNRSNLFDVKDKVVVITGGGRGIGKMMADGFVQNGAKVYIASRRLDACEATAKELNAKGPGKCIPLEANLLSENGCKELAEQIAKKEKKVDVLINNSGVSWGGDFDHHPEAAWNKVLTVNVTSPFHLTKFLLPLLDAAATSSDAARVINIGSVAGLRPQQIDTIAYDTSKAAIHHMTRVLAAKLARRPNGGHILVNAIAPGLVPSKMSKGISVVTGLGMDDLATGIPIERFGKDSDMAGLAIFLSSKASGWITGMVIASDGGQVYTMETGVGPSKL